MKVDVQVALENASHEAIIRQAYKDSVGKWTWSVGLTSATGHQVDRYINNPQPLQHCLNVYVWALENYAAVVREVFQDQPLTQPQFAAILSWTWNLGGGALKRASWVKHFKAGDMAKAEASFKSWCKAGGKKLPGLVKRRQAEADLLFRGVWSNRETMVEYTKLKHNSTPDWSSAKTISVKKELERAFRSTSPDLDSTPDPKAKQPVPTVTPEVIPRQDLWDIIVGLILRLFGGK